MAITKIHAIKSTLGKALAYIENPDKTDGQMLVSGYNCEPQTASIDFEMTAVLAHKARNLKRKRSTNLAYHLIQSFSPEDAVTPEQAHELGKKLAFEYTGGKYEYVVATHIDKGHIHNHIMLNAVSFYDYKTLRTVPYRTARQIRDISDRLCMEAHLSVIDDPQKIGQLYPENAGKKKSASNRTEIRKRLDFCLERATDYSQFLSMAEGLEITPTIRGKHMVLQYDGSLVTQWGEGIAADQAGYYASDEEKLYYVDFETNECRSLDGAGQIDSYGVLATIKGSSFCRNGIFYYVDDQGIVAYDTTNNSESRILTDTLAPFLQDDVSCVTLIVTDHQAIAVAADLNSETQTVYRYEI